MKRICTMLAAAMLLFSAVSAAAYTDITPESEFGKSVEKLSTLGMINGYEDGSFRPDAPVTRAEFSKLVVAALGQQDNVVAGESASPFTDVPMGHWATGYINYVSTGGYIKGYPDGSFHPDENIPYEQAATVLVRMLGYTTEDVGYHWPKNYLEKAQALGLNDGLGYTEGTILDRKGVAALIDNTLDTDVKGTAGAPSQTLLESIGYQLLEDVVIIAGKAQDVSVPADEVKTSAGTYPYKLDNMADYLEKTCDIYLDKDGEIVLADPQPQTAQTIVVDSVLGDQIFYIQDGSKQKIELEDETVVYSKGQQSQFAAMKSQLAIGSTISAYYGEAGELEYVFLSEGELQGPVTVTGSGTITAVDGYPIAADARVYRNGLAVNLSDLEVHDIVYYNPATNVVMAYAEKRTGIYEEAYPSKAYVERISLSGVEYTIETETATEKLNESPGSFQKNQKITLLLGKDGQIVDVIADVDSELDNMGVLLSTSSAVSTEEETKGRLEYFATLFKYDGNTYTYKTDKDYADWRGAMVRLSFDETGLVNGMTRCTNGITGKLDKVAMTLGGTKLSKDVKIIELMTDPDIDGDASARLLELSDIDKVTFDEGDVLHAEKDKNFGDITLLFVNNITNDGYQYGILKSKNVINAGMTVSGTYTIDIGGTEMTFQLPSAYSIASGQPIGVDVSNGRLNHMFALEKAADGRKVEAVDYDRIKVDGTVYNMSSDVVVYERSNATYQKTPISVNELTEMQLSSVQLFADKLMGMGGKVRVIVVTPKL